MPDMLGALDILEVKAKREIQMDIPEVVDILEALVPMVAKDSVVTLVVPALDI